MGSSTALQVDDGGAGTPAIEALGSLFKLTQVYLCADGYTDTQETWPATKSNKSPICDGDAGSNDITISVEDMELIEQMDALGLPVSFQTNKQKKSGKSKAKKKSSRTKDTSGFKEIENEAPELCKVSEDTQKSICSAAEGESTSLTSVDVTVINEPISGELSSSQMATWDRLYMEDGTLSKREFQAYTELDHFGVAHFLPCDPTEACADYMMEESAVNSIEHKHLDVNHDEVIQACTLAEPIFHEEAAVSLMPGVFQNDEMDGYMCSREYGEWRVYWDSFYLRNYYYSVKTKESTWSPPPGMEDETFFDCTDNFNGNTDKPDEVLATVSETVISHASASQNVSDEDCKNDSRSPAFSMTNSRIEVVSEETLQSDELDAQCESHVRKMKKGVRKKRGQRTSSGADEELKFPLIEEYSTPIKKYWYQRYLLFSRFDDGVKLDEEGWFSVTPEPIAKHHALRCGNKTIIDGFAGVGGNAIQFAKRAKHTIAVDIDPTKIEYAYHNAVIYEVDDRIDFVMGDLFLLAPKLKADTVFLSPPWGGPDYNKVEIYDIKTMLKPHDGFFLFKAVKEIASKVVMFLPKNVDVNQLAELSLSSNPPWSLEVERNFLNGKLKAITAYFTNPQISEQ